MPAYHATTRGIARVPSLCHLRLQLVEFSPTARLGVRKSCLLPHPSCHCLFPGGSVASRRAMPCLSCCWLSALHCLRCMNRIAGALLDGRCLSAVHNVGLSTAGSRSLPEVCWQHSSAGFSTGTIHSSSRQCNRCLSALRPGRIDLVLIGSASMQATF